MQLFRVGWVFWLAITSGVNATFQRHRKPNILFIFADDQDLELGSLDYLPTVRSRIQDEGFAFDNHYATVALCCPSRVALLRGQHAHNTNNTFVQAPGGGYDKFRLSGEDRDYLPHWLRQAGYRSEYIGKLMNQYGVYNYQISPRGWDRFDGLLDPYTYIYNTPVFSLNGARPVYYHGYHQTDVVRAKAVDRLNKLMANSSQPWYLQVAATAPHQQFNVTGRFPPVPLTRHANLFPELKAPRTPNFNPANQDKPSWVGELKPMSDAQIAFSDATYRGRAQALVGVDEMVQNLLDVLESAGQLENTVVIYSADHGYHVGQHRIPAGKTLPYREDTHVPFFIRGPGIPKGGSTMMPSTHVDIAPTILTYAGLPTDQWPAFLDGRDLSTDWVGHHGWQDWHGQKTQKQSIETAEVVNVEYWGAAIPEGAIQIPNAIRNSYKTVRVIGPDYGYLYSHWCTNETEMYDTVQDPYELNRIPASEQPALADRLNGLLLATKTCSLDSCRNPWKYIHPDGGVRNIKDALDPKYDAYYASLPRVSFKECLAFQLPSNEAPFFPGFDANSPEAFSQAFRGLTDALGSAQYPGTDDAVETIPEGRYGAVYQDLDVIEQQARELTDGEINDGTGLGLRIRGMAYYG